MFASRGLLTRRALDLDDSFTQSAQCARAPARDSFAAFTAPCLLANSTGRTELDSTDPTRHAELHDDHECIDGFTLIDL